MCLNNKVGKKQLNFFDVILGYMRQNCKIVIDLLFFKSTWKKNIIFIIYIVRTKIKLGDAALCYDGYIQQKTELTEEKTLNDLVFV